MLCRKSHLILVLPFLVRILKFIYAEQNKHILILLYRKARRVYFQYLLISKLCIDFNKKLLALTVSSFPLKTSNKFPLPSSFSTARTRINSELSSLQPDELIVALVPMEEKITEFQNMLYTICEQKSMEDAIKNSQIEYS